MSDQPYCGPDRRSVTELEVTFDKKLREHEVREQERIEALIDALKHDAFPDGLEKHRDYHQAKINAAKDEAEFWKAAKLELTKVGVSTIAGVLKIILGLAFVGLLYKLGLGSFASGIVK